MKKLLVVSLLSLILLAASFPIPTAYAASATLSLNPATGTFNKGCSFTIKIEEDTGGAQIDGTDVYIYYDSTRFLAKTIIKGTIGLDYPGNNIDTQLGKITVSGISSVSSAFSGVGTLASIDFTVLDNAPVGATKMRFDFDPSDKTKTTDTNVVERGTVADILGEVNDGNYTIGSGTGCTVTPPRGAVDSTPSATIFMPKPEPKSTVLPNGADFRTTAVIAALGGILTLIGILGLALL